LIQEILFPFRKKCGWYDCIEIESLSLPISFKNNRIYSLLESRNHGYGIRVNADGKTGFSYTNRAQGLTCTVESALAMAPFGEKEGFTLPPSDPPVSFEPYSREIESVDADHEIHKGNEAIAALVKRFPGVMVDCGISISRGMNRVVNSSGIDVRYRYSRYSFSLSATISFDDGSRLSIGEGLAFREPVAVEGCVDTLMEKLDRALRIRKIPSGIVPVIVTPKAFCSLLGILTAGLSARSVYKGISPFAGKCGHRLFNPGLTMFDDPLLNDSPYSYPFDDEAVIARKKYIIERGVLTTFVADLKYAEKLGMEPTGNGIRGYSSLPSPSFSNVVLIPGSVPVRDMIAETAHGIMVDQFIGLGQSNTITGDFSANLDCAYLIEKGEISGRIKDCMLTDNLFSLLAGELEISAETERHGSAVVPWVRFPESHLTA